MTRHHGTSLSSGSAESAHPTVRGAPRRGRGGGEPLGAIVLLLQSHRRGARHELNEHRNQRHLARAMLIKRFGATEIVEFFRYEARLFVKLAHRRQSEEHT